MDDFSEIASIRDSYIVDSGKNLIPIGLYGSFLEQNLTIINSLKDSLNKEGYFAITSLDIGKICPKPSDMKHKTYNYIISRTMTRINDIGLVLIFKGGAGPNSINTGVTMELQQLSEFNKKNVLLLFEEDSRQHISSLVIGLSDIEDWESKDFFRDNIDALCVESRQYCHDRIFMNPYARFSQISEYNDQALKIYLEEVNASFLKAKSNMYHS